MSTVTDMLTAVQTKHNECVSSSSVQFDSTNQYRVSWACGSASTAVTGSQGISEAHRRHVTDVLVAGLVEWLRSDEVTHAAAQAIASDFYAMEGGDLRVDPAPEPNEGDHSLGGAVANALALLIVRNTEASAPNAVT